MNEERDLTLLWVEKYRPKCIADCVLPSHLRATFEGMVKEKNLPNLMLAGSPGNGKTSVARAMATELGYSCMVVNGSKDGNIDTLRTTIQSYASKYSLTGSKKLIVLDEADYLNAQSTQPALRGFMEEFAENSRFVFTCNHKNRIIKPLHSRCTVIDFVIPEEERPVVAAQFMRRCVELLTAEGVEFSKKVVAQLIQMYFPDFRRVINELQNYAQSSGKKIDEGVLVRNSNFDIAALYRAMKEKHYGDLRAWVVQALAFEPARVYRAVFDELIIPKFKPSSVPRAVVLLSDYEDKVQRGAMDDEITLLAFLTEVMASCEIE